MSVAYGRSSRRRAVHYARFLCASDALLVHERRRPTRDERIHRRSIDLQVQHIVRHECDHQAIGEHAVFAEHPPSHHGAERREHVLQVLDELAHAAPLVPADRPATTHAARTSPQPSRGLLALDQHGLAIRDTVRQVVQAARERSQQQDLSSSGTPR